MKWICCPSCEFAMWWSCSVCAVSSKLLTLYLTVTFAESVPTFSAVIDAISRVAPGNSFACAKGFTAILPTESAKAVVSCVSPSVFFVVGLHATSVADAATNARAVFKLVIFIPFDLIIFYDLLLLLLNKYNRKKFYYAKTESKAI